MITLYPTIADELILDIEGWNNSLKVPCDADYSGDIAGGYGVDLADFAAIAAHLGETGCGASDDCQCADVDQSGTVNLADLLDVIEDWLKGI